jgi:hypothetical protein
MSKFITLKMVNSNEERQRSRSNVLNDLIDRHDEPADRDEDGEDSGEDDGLTNGGVTTLALPAPAPWQPLTINTDSIRNFYPRKDGRTGCRVLLKTGTAYAVLDEHAEILAMLNS